MGKHKSRHFDQNGKRDQFLHNPRTVRRRVSWNWMLILAGMGFLAVLLYVSAAVPTPASEAAEKQPADTLPTGQEVRLAAASFANGQAKFYRYLTAAGREIRFFVLRSSDGVVRAAFDACDVCYRERKGYHQSGDDMICNNCGRAFRSVNVNVVTGGCNPGPLQRTVVADQIVITPAALESGVSYF